MTVANSTGDDRMAKLKQYGSTGMLVAGAFALIAYLRSQGGRDRMNSLLGGQLSGLEEQLQTAMQENMPMIDEAIDNLADALKQGIEHLSSEVEHYAEEAKMRIREYAATPALSAGSSDYSGSERSTGT